MFFLAEITSPSADNDLLIKIDSFCVSPWAPDFDNLSDPAKSIKWSFEVQNVEWNLFSVWRCIVKIKWERLECSFKFVAATARFLIPISKKFSISSDDVTFIIVKSGI